jgi:hypothetical protein
VASREGRAAQAVEQSLFQYRLRARASGEASKAKPRGPERVAEPALARESLTLSPCDARRPDAIPSIIYTQSGVIKPLSPPSALSLSGRPHGLLDSTHQPCNRLIKSHGEPCLRRYDLARAGCDLVAVVGQAMSIWDAAQSGDLAEVERLVGQDPSLLDARGADGPTALMWASIKGHVGVVRWLVDKGAGLNEREDFGATALWFACGHARIPVVTLLLESGADPTIAVEDGTTPLMVALSTAMSRSCACFSVTLAARPP